MNSLYSTVTFVLLVLVFPCAVQLGLAEPDGSPSLDALRFKFMIELEKLGLPAKRLDEQDQVQLEKLEWHR